MGCCISKTPPARPKPPPRPFSTAPPLPPPLCYAGPSPPQPLSQPVPSPLPFEEESVKEVVISEISPPPTVPDHPLTLQHSPPRPKLTPPPRQPGHPQTPRKLDAAETDILISKLEQAADVVSEYSDMYTMSGSLSVSTTATTGTNATLADRKDSEVTSKASSRPPVARSSPNKPTRKRPPLVGGEERARGASPPVRRVQQASPERGRRAVVGQVRDPSGGVRRNGSQGRRDSGEISRRRSSSPTQGRAGVGKSPSKRIGSKLSGQGMESGSNPQFLSRERDMEEESSVGVAGQEEDGNGVVLRDEDHHDNVRGGNDGESLENPHVSLECFIFL